MSQTVIGLDIGTWSIKAAILDASIRRFTLTDYREYHVPRGPQGMTAEGDEVSGLVARVLDGIKQRGAIATAVPNNQVLTRELELPFADDKRIQSVLAFQLDGELPVPIEKLVYDYYPLDKRDDGSTLICAAIDRDWLAHRLEQLKDVEADPRVVCLDTLTYAHLTPHLAGASEEETVALIDLGHMSSTISIVRQGRVEGIRSIPRGGHHLTSALMKHYELDYAQAESLKHTGVRLDGFVAEGADPAGHQERCDLIVRALQPLVRTLRTTLHAHSQRRNVHIDRALIFGGGAQLAGVSGYLAEVLQLQIDRPNILSSPWATLERDPEIELRIPKATALALQLVTGDAEHSSNFRQGEFAFESDFKAFRDRALWMGGMAMVLIALLFGGQLMHKNRLADNHAALVSELNEFNNKIFSEDILSTFPDGISFETTKQLLSEDTPSDEKNKKQKIFPKITAFKTLYDITSAVESVNQQGEDAALEALKSTKDPATNGDINADANKEESSDGQAPGPRDAAPPLDADKTTEGTEEALDVGYKLELNSLNISVKSVQIEAVTNKPPAVDIFVAELRKHHCFKEVESRNLRTITRSKRSGWREFTIDLKLECPESDASKANKASENGSAAKGEDAKTEEKP